MALKQWQVKFLERKHFLPLEINELNNSHVSMNKLWDTQIFQNTIESRKKWWDMACSPEKQGGLNWTRKQTTDSLIAYYNAKKGRSIFDFVIIEIAQLNKECITWMNRLVVDE